MAQTPLTPEISVALARFFYGGAGPSHARIGTVAITTGHGGDDPYSATTQGPNKEERVRTLLEAARRRPAGARALVEALLVQLRVHGCFSPDLDTHDAYKVRTAQKAFSPCGLGSE
ncbi:MAG: hypothetical protein ACRDNK_12785 [Solirubrobacteraceae bacterium]